MELSVKDPRGPWVHVGDLHGQVVVLLLLGTFDTISQAELVPFERIAIRRPDIAFVGVLAQPGAAQFADAFVNALSPTFPMGYDPDNQLMQGRTLLGPITTIPTIIVLDRSGHIVVRKEGFVSERLLEQSIDEAQSREPTEATTSPPLLGGSIHQPN